jgi:NAD(P)H dehydrogenase (quinone)
MPKQILLILAHPQENSLCAALADAYAQGAQHASHDVQRLYLGRMQFDPLLHHGYAKIQPLEPDLAAAQAAIAAAQHLVFVYPTWWGAPPALLKGFIDRIFLPGFAFRYRKDSVWWDKLLAGRSAHLLVTMDTPPWYFRWIYRMPGHQQMRRTVLEFCGIKPVKITSFGSARSASAPQRAKWLEQARTLGLKA